MSLPYARLSGALLLALLLALPAQAAADATPVDVVDGAVVWTPAGEFAQALLTLTSPSGLEYRRAFEAGEALRLHPGEIGDVPLADGFYGYELLIARTVPDADEPAAAVSQSGTVEVRGGVAVESPVLDIVHLDDVIIQFSLCVGNDCVNGESFGFDTIRLKENNLRIKFQDTSTSASFPTNDWQITINDSSNGGANYFRVDDVSGSRSPFTIEAGARNHALYVETDGDIGIGTSNPVVDLHVQTGNTPTVRLDQDGSNGFSAQTWDLAGNEANFFIRDATNGSQLVFRVFPNAGGNLLNLANNRVSINDTSPGSTGTETDGRLHVRSTGTDRALSVDASTTTTTTDGAAMLVLAGEDPGLKVDGTNVINFQPAVDVIGAIRASGTIFSTSRVSVTSDGVTEPFAVILPGVAQLLALDVSGNLTAHGEMNATAFNTTSDASRKENVAPADVDAVLDGVAALPISTWEFIGDESGGLHLGPMAQDFAAAFGLGSNDTQIATVDADGVALAAIQALHARSEADAVRIAELEEANAALEARLARLEALLQADRTDHE